MENSGLWVCAVLLESCAARMMLTFGVAFSELQNMVLMGYIMILAVESYNRFVLLCQDLADNVKGASLVHFCGPC